MMMSLKQKDDVISQQNMKLSQFGSPNSQMAVGFNGSNNFMAGPQNSNMLNNPQNNMYGMPSQIQGISQNFLGKQINGFKTYRNY